MRIGMLLFPKLTQLDLTGPHEVFARIPGAEVLLVSATREPVVSESGLAILPTATYAEAGAVDIVFAPGGVGQIAAIEHAPTMTWLREVGPRASWVTSACTGALLLGAAGLLQGYRATTHWAFHELLALVGATPVHERVVVDRNRITGGGVTAGIDAALAIAAQVRGREVAEAIQLQLEYDPHPPFAAGHPRSAPAELVERVRGQVRDRFEERSAQLRRLGLSGRNA